MCARDDRFESSCSILLLTGEEGVWERWQLDILACAGVDVLFWGSTVELLVGERAEFDDSLLTLIG